MIRWIQDFYRNSHNEDDWSKMETGVGASDLEIILTNESDDL